MITKKWNEYFEQQHKEFVDEHNWEYWLVCDNCGVITHNIYRDDEGDECEDCHNERYKNNESEWLIKYYFDNDVTDEQRNSMKNWTDEDFERECDWEGGENYYYTECADYPDDEDEENELFEYIYNRVIELEHEGIYIDWR